MPRLLLLLRAPTSLDPPNLLSCSQPLGTKVSPENTEVLGPLYPTLPGLRPADEALPSWNTSPTTAALQRSLLPGCLSEDRAGWACISGESAPGRVNSCHDRGVCLNKAGVSTVSCGDDLPYCRATLGPPELLSWSLRPLMRSSFPPWSCPITAPCALERDLSVCWRTSFTSQRKLNSRKHVCLLNKEISFFLLA